MKLSTAGELTPPALVATAVTLATPAGKLRPVVDQAPVLSAVTLKGPPNEPGLALRLTTAFGVAVPLMVGLVVAVPLLAGLKIATTGTSRAVTLTGWDTLPPGPDAVTVSGVTPVDTVTGHENVPDTLAVVVHKVVLPGPLITI